MRRVGEGCESMGGGDGNDDVEDVSRGLGAEDKVRERKREKGKAVDERVVTYVSTDKWGCAHLRVPQRVGTEVAGVLC